MLNFYHNSSKGEEERGLETKLLVAIIIVIISFSYERGEEELVFVRLGHVRPVEQPTKLSTTTTTSEGYFVVFSDFHSNPKYSRNGEKANFSMCIESDSASEVITNANAPKREELGAFGEYDCDSPMSVALTAINKAQKLLPQPDFVIWLGDSLGHLPKRFATDEYKMQIIANLTEHLSSKFPQAPIYPLIGNHDGNPKKDSDSAEYGRHFERLLVSGKWDQLLADDSQLKTFRHGGFYSSKLGDHTLMIFMNGFLHYYDNENLDGEDPFGHFQWLQEQLENAKRENLKVLIFNHFSVGKVVFELSSKPVFKEKYLLKFTDLLERYADLVTGVFMGHSHTDTFRLIGGKPGHAPLPGFVHTSLSSFQSNPSFRIYQYSTVNNQIVLNDYWQYYLDLKEANRLDRIDWKLSYRFTELYKLPDLSGASLATLHARLSRSHRLERHRSKNYRDFFQNLRTKIDRRYLGECTQDLIKCERMNICATKYFTHDEFTECVAAS